MSASERQFLVFVAIRNPDAGGIHLGGVDNVNRARKIRPRQACPSPDDVSANPSSGHFFRGSSPSSPAKFSGGGLCRSSVVAVGDQLGCGIVHDRCRCSQGGDEPCDSPGGGPWRSSTEGRRWRLKRA
jgi:hypothetical protein